MRDGLKGLTSEEAQSRLKAEGYNELPRAGHRSLLRIALEVVREPMFGLLIGSGVIYLLLGDHTEALILLAFASISVIIAIVQESRSERVLEALRDLTSPRALVIRDGERERIPGREVVRGDIVVLGEGDRVPADAWLIAATDVQADESLLTGESAPVRKVVADVESRASRPGGDDLPFVFSGTLVVRGQGLAEVQATGPRSEIGQIGQALQAIDHEPPHLTQETRQLVRVFALFGLAACALTVILFGLWRGSWLDALLAGIALGMSMLPEEFPLVLTVFMVMGAWRISQARVLTRRAAAIETLGAATVLCTDKTGTLTENRMSIVCLAAGAEMLRLEPRREGSLPERFRCLVDYGRLASAPDPFDPMEKAFHALAAQFGRGEGHPGRKEELVRTYGLRPDLLAVTQVWKVPGTDDCRVAAKGAPEAIAALCRFDPEVLAALARDVDRMATEGMRVLAVAEARFRGEDWPTSPKGFAFTFLGLVGLADPLRSSVLEAVRECRSAGIRVVMITGDYPATALTIAGKAGLDTDAVVTGDDIEAMSEAELSRRVASVSVFARTMPAQKLRIVRALKATGAIVAMTGDGVNDAPSLKAADIGIAMGGRGTDVAREAAALVLLDDDFGSVVKTVRLGRRIYDNLRKAMGYILAVHVPIAGLALLPLLTGLPIIFSPIHIAFLEMIIDPVCSVVFEAEKEEKDIMRRPPRAATSRLFSSGLVLWSLLQGALAFGVVAVLYLLALQRGMPEGDVRALTFVSLVLANLGLVLVNRSFDSSVREALRWDNRALWWVSAATAVLLSIALAWEPARGLFRFGPLHADDLAVAFGAAIGLVVVLEILKRFWRGWLTA
ncbi:Ca2+-transporting ATPase [Roseomonas rosea]|uniref:Ca2+-transporting ATPase n=1 Tax=Muricoccus roseus TaxID=198092 RepID=A0A1M6QPM8_9PROT|nr:cation-translocating P-type ATPase [Roseomonas rosea]SHK22098.1 Ca2+-transporting ATPase [Roseomonas rosea]